MTNHPAFLFVLLAGRTVAAPVDPAPVPSPARVINHSPCQSEKTASPSAPGRRGRAVALAAVAAVLRVPRGARRVGSIAPTAGRAPRVPVIPGAAGARGGSIGSIPIRAAVRPSGIPRAWHDFFASSVWAGWVSGRMGLPAAPVPGRRSLGGTPDDYACPSAWPWLAVCGSICRASSRWAFPRAGPSCAILWPCGACCSVAGESDARGRRRPMRRNQVAAAGRPAAAPPGRYATTRATGRRSHSGRSGPWRQDCCRTGSS